jgi:hypothetical protein
VFPERKSKTNREMQSRLDRLRAPGSGGVRAVEGQPGAGGSRGAAHSMALVCLKMEKDGTVLRKIYTEKSMHYNVI